MKLILSLIATLSVTLASSAISSNTACRTNLDSTILGTKKMCGSFSNTGLFTANRACSTAETTSVCTSCISQDTKSPLKAGIGCEVLNDNTMCGTVTSKILDVNDTATFKITSSSNTKMCVFKVESKNGKSTRFEWKVTAGTSTQFLAEVFTGRYLSTSKSLDIDYVGDLKDEERLGYLKASVGSWTSSAEKHHMMVVAPEVNSKTFTVTVENIGSTSGNLTVLGLIIGLVVLCCCCCLICICVTCCCAYMKCQRLSRGKLM